MANRSFSFLIYGISLCILHSILFSCATPIAPDGGPKDETPPSIDSVGTTPNFQTNFQKQRIEITFDEWIKLDDVFNEVVVSPPLNKRPQITTKGKTVRVDFDEEEVLREAATYTINFGEAVQDLTESNPAEDLRFVFSTGDFIDSLEISGTIKDALTNEPVEGALFMLYDNLSDTVVRTELPFYFAKTDKSGRFTIRNIKSGTFKGFALINDFGYLYDQENEQIGFPNELIPINDSTTHNLMIKVFQANPPLRIQEVEDRSYGQLKVKFNQTPYDLDLIYELTDQTVLYEFEKDTLKFWYDQPDTTPWKLIVRQDTILEDTINIKAVDRTNFVKDNPLKLNKEETRKNIKINPGSTVKLAYNRPLISIDPNRIQLLEDTTLTRVNPQVSIDSLAFRTLNIQYAWKEGKSYVLEILPDALTDLYGLTNPDTLSLNYNIELIKNLGIIDLSVNGLSADTAYVIELYAGESNLIDTIQARGSTIVQKRYENLNPGKFSVRIITDINNNGRWDTGSYDEQRQPEAIFKRELEALRANWEVKAEVTLGVLPEPEEEEEEEGN